MGRTIQLLYTYNYKPIFSIIIYLKQKKFCFLFFILDKISIAQFCQLPVSFMTVFKILLLVCICIDKHSSGYINDGPPRHEAGRSLGPKDWLNQKLPLDLNLTFCVILYL